MKKFNIRVYGVCVNEKNEVLLSNERYKDLAFTKFPGGGLEWGEGTTDCLKREFLEEFNLDIEVGELFYFTDFFQVSAFSENDQVISIYYRVQLMNEINLQTQQGDKNETLEWKSVNDLTDDVFRFPIDKLVGTMLKDGRTS